MLWSPSPNLPPPPASPQALPLELQPEDVGWIPGFDEFLDAMTKPRHPDHQRLTEWYSGSFDPDDLNLPVISSRIGELARRRALGKAGYAKSRGRTR